MESLQSSDLPVLCFGSLCPDQRSRRRHVDCDLCDPGQSHSSAQRQSRCNRSCDLEDAIRSPFLTVSGWSFLSVCFLASIWQEKHTARGGGQGALWIGHYRIVASSLPEFWEAVRGWPEAPNRRLHFNLSIHNLALYLLQQGDENILAPTLQNRHLRNKEPHRINECSALISLKSSHSFSASGWE